MKNYAIIVAGGTGTRMKGELPKQFLLLKNKPVILHSTEAFAEFDPLLEIILVIHPDYLEYWERLCNEYKVPGHVKVAPGGKTRFESVKNGIALIEADGWVAVHDAARPLITREFVEELFNEASIKGSAVPGIAINDTVRMLDGKGSVQLDRTLLRAMQTPQVYRVSEIKKAFTQPFQPGFTDEASVMQAAGFTPNIVPGLPTNLKITRPEDLALAEYLLNTGV